MVNQSIQRFFLVFAAILFASSAIAESYAVRVPGGKRILVATFALYDTDTCTFGEVPEGKLVTPPQHGRVEILQERRVFVGGRCGRIEGWARNVYFTPSRGFRGTDAMRVDFQYNRWSDAPGLTAVTRSITLQIQ